VSRRTLRFLAPGAALFLLLSSAAFAAVETESVHSYWEGLRAEDVEPLIGRPVDGWKPTPRSSGRSMSAPARRGKGQSDNRHTKTRRGE
jgi:hypothetical protein